MIKVSYSYHLRMRDVISTMSFGVAALMLMLPLPALAAAMPTDNKMVTIYDGSVERTTITRAKNVNDALRDAKIKLNNGDQTSMNGNDQFKGSVVVLSVQRARSVTVADGNKVSRVLTANQDGGEIVNHVMGNYKAGDQVKRSLVKDFIANGGAGERVEVKRSRPVSFILYGKPVTINTLAKTVGELIKSMGVYLQHTDHVSVDLNTSVVANMKPFSINREGESTVDVTENIPMETETRVDPSKKIGYKEVLQEGHNGMKLVVYQVAKTQDGSQVHSKINEAIVVSPVKQIEIVGSKVELPAGSHQDWMAAAGIAPSDYGYVEFIISHESGWRPNARNQSGKYVGLGQTSLNALSGSCPNWQVDPICQLRHFTNYANSRYGGWKGSYEKWTKSHNW